MPLSSIVKDLVKLYRITPNLGEILVLRCSLAGIMVELAGIEPAASGLQNRRSPN
jgi:hypothetical protein